MEVPQIQIQDAKKKLDERACLFVDIRDPGSYEQAHIPGAIRLHDGNVQEFLQSADKSKEMIVYCYHGNSSLGATAFLIDNGFTHATSMSGGSVDSPTNDCVVSPLGAPSLLRVVTIVTPVGNEPASCR